jgi:hypothetical protein
MKDAGRMFMLAFFVARPLHAADPPPKTVFRVEGTASAEEQRAPDGTWIGRTTRTRHDFVSAPRAGEHAHLLLTSRFTREVRSGFSRSRAARARRTGS